MLKLKDRLYVKRLIESGYLYITKQDKENLTDKDVEKVRYVLKKDKFAYITFNYLSRVSFSKLCNLIACYGMKWDCIEKVIYKGYNLDKFIDKIVKKYPNYSDNLSDMISCGYTIEQMEFLLKNNMIYDMYHNEFDYENIFKRCQEIGFDVTKEYCNRYPIEFLEILRKVGTPKECYELLDEARFVVSTDKCIDICNFLIDKEFKILEIILVIKKGIKIEQLKLYFSYGGNKEGLMQQIALSL